MKRFLLAFAAVSLLAGCAAPTPTSTSSGSTAPTSSSPSPTASEITLEKYNQIKAGMTQDQVEEVLGKGTEMSRVEMPNVPVTVVYMWQNPNGSNMNVTFQGGKVVTLAQFGLK
ncbi:MAG: outer membrane protein assembly factor BamE [Oculatellaceae cyanobacterium bins.114]|nr:outer membrane protein assembly factor BamE [Oculatellaceae cyanobacterium bins.114]